MEFGEGSGTSLDTEDAKVSYTMVNGREAMLIEEDEWIMIAWTMHNRFFVVDTKGSDIDTVLKIASSFVLVR